ncbi:hypothetical protein Clacol_002314 [Clathrus columnatus]|uniref:Uncharacterized protein n=1 Tax=Clathrus columnatus TaxID=1419009 RepID=A0AAV5A6C2_9AGAM|nr:hypothetical protein Clacol_002314 [Clathrus columnatus]
MSSDDSPHTLDLDLPLLLKPSSTTKPNPISASSLLSTLKTAQSDSNPFKTSSEPIDSLLGPILRPGYALQISSPPGLYVEQLLIGLIKNITRVGKEVMVIDMQNKLTPSMISWALNKDDRSKKVYYQKCFMPDDLISKLNELPGFIQTHPDLTLLILPSISFPLQTELNYSRRNKLIEQIRELTVKLCKNLNIAVRQEAQNFEGRASN